LAKAEPWVKSLDQWFCPVHRSADWVESEIYSKFQYPQHSAGHMQQAGGAGFCLVVDPDRLWRRLQKHAAAMIGKEFGSLKR